MKGEPKGGSMRGVVEEPMKLGCSVACGFICLASGLLSCLITEPEKCILFARVTEQPGQGAPKQLEGPHSPLTL